MTFGEEVRRLREELNISQGELAERLGVNQTFVSKVERGVTGLGADVLFKLCDALKVQPEHFRPFLAAADEPKKKGKKK